MVIGVLHFVLFCNRVDYVCRLWCLVFVLQLLVAMACMHSICNTVCESYEVWWNVIPVKAD